jgi:hypothetical protein
MTFVEHRRKHRRTRFGAEHRRTDFPPTAADRSAGQSTDGSTDATDAPEHRRSPTSLEEVGDVLDPINPHHKDTPMTTTTNTAAPEASPHGFGHAIRRVLCLGAITAAAAGAVALLIAGEVGDVLRHGFRRAEPTLSDRIDRAVQRERRRTQHDHRPQGDHR